MAINKKLELYWKGKPYPIIINMRMVDDIESQGINLIKMQDQLNRGDVRFSHAAKLISILLNFGGADVSQDQVWEGMFSDGDLQAVDCIPLLKEIFLATFPDIKKKSIEVAKKKRRASKSTRGKTSTK